MESLKGYAVYTLNTTGLIAGWSIAAQEMLGYTAIEVMGKPVSFFYTEDSVQKNEAQENLIKAQENEQHQTEGWRVTKTGKKLWLKDTFTALYKAGGEPGGFSVTGTILKNKENGEPGKQALEGAQEKFRIYNDELKMLASHLQTVREEERAAMAREIHDELGQQITGLKMDVSWLEKRIQQEDDSVKKRIKTVISLLDDTVKMVRKIASDLRPGILDDFGLVDALQWYSKEFEKSAGIAVLFESAHEEINIEKNMVTGLFRIFQESLANIAAYTFATAIKANIQKKEGEILLMINYKGDEPGEQKDVGKRKLRLMDMQERMMTMGGSYEVKSNLEDGTTVYVSVPLHKA